MDEAKKIIINLEGERKVPQLVFFDSINPFSMIAIRKEILNYKKDNPTVNEVDFIINSPGGSPSDAYRIIRTLRKAFETVNVIVPFWAKSAATLLSLGGSTIIMDEFAEFGPLDAQLRKENDEKPDAETQSALIDEHSLNRIEKRAQELYHSMLIDLMQSKDVRIGRSKLSEQILTYISHFYEPLLSKIDPYQIGEKKRYLEIGEKYAERILVMYNNVKEEDRELFIDYIVHECPDHGFVIDYDLISTFLPNVKKSDAFGQKYSEFLTTLSTLLIDTDTELRYIGFITAEKIVEEVSASPKIDDKNQSKIKKQKS